MGAERLEETKDGENGDVESWGSALVGEPVMVADGVSAVVDAGSPIPGSVVIDGAG